MTGHHARRVVGAVVSSLVVLVLAAGCAGKDEPTAAPDTTAAPVTAARAPGPGCGTDPGSWGPRSTHVRVDLPSGGDDRWYTRWVPTSADGSALPLVVDLHGYLSGAAGQAAISDLGAKADEAGFVVVTPQGNSELPYWNAVPHPELPDDLAFVEAVIDDVSATVCIDPRRVYVDGLSNGAFLASLIACRLSDRVAAVAAVAGLQLPSGCRPGRPIPVLGIHGTADQFVSFTGPPNPALASLSWNDESTRAFDGLPFGDVTAAAAAWAALDGCDPDPTRTPVGPSVERIAYGECEGNAAVELYVVRGGGHTWPGSDFTAAATALGPTTDEIDANDVLWDFFAAHPLT